MAAACSTAPAIRAAAAPPLEYRVPFTRTAPSLKAGLEGGAWAAAPWTADFVDIEGSVKPKPAYRTRAKMLWDDRHLYVAAELEEPNLWDSLTKRDQIIFHDNDFEVFIDPDGDTREYYEIEVNQHPAIFDLYLQRMYREGGPAVHAWNCEGLRVELAFDGTRNNPNHADGGWTVQLSIPWTGLRPPDAASAPELAGKPTFTEPARAGKPPLAGDTWRINFSRVQWRNNHEVLDAQNRRVPGAKPIESSVPYAKVPDLPEDNWVWTPQWTIDMHLPQFWGRVTFVH
jgi:hypothetical protein